MTIDIKNDDFIKKNKSISIRLSDVNKNWNTYFTNNKKCNKIVF